MVTLDQILPNIKAITFDCYGTLIDWRAGWRSTFLEMFGPTIDNRLDELAAAYETIEAQVEAERFRSYRDVLTEVAKRLAKQFDLPLPPDRADLLARALPQWSPFADTREALTRLKQRYRLGVLSNVDRDLFSGTARHLGVAFDFVVAAQDVRAYKPAHAHFERLLSTHEPRENVLHVAQSLFHDGAPANQLDIPFVWINRYNEPNKTDVKPLGEFADLKSLADAVG